MDGLALGRGCRWALIAFVIFFGLNTFSLLDGLGRGSAVYARADLAVGLGLWVVELAAVALTFGQKDRGLPGGREGRSSRWPWRVSRMTRP